MILAILFRALLLAHTTGAPQAHAYAAALAETRLVSAELLLAQSYSESRWSGNVVSRIEKQADGSRKRKAGPWSRGFPKRFASPYFCGASQLQARSEKQCRALGRDTLGNYQRAVGHFMEWWRLCKRHTDRLTCTLAGYGGGVNATRDKSSRGWKYSLRVQRRAKRYSAQRFDKRPRS